MDVHTRLHMQRMWFERTDCRRPLSTGACTHGIGEEAPWKDGRCTGCCDWRRPHHQAQQVQGGRWPG
eukprot:352476-Chlamydomonas_euryale.AAC.32